MKNGAKVGDSTGGKADSAGGYLHPRAANRGLLRAKVARLALENAASIAALLLTTEAVVSEIAEEKEAPQMSGGGGMGGMM